MKRTLCGLLFFSAISCALSATIPAGTEILALTTDAVSTHERIGATFNAALAYPVVVQSKVVLPSGTPIICIVEGSLRPPNSKGAVIVNLKSVAVNGRQVPVQTTGAYRLPPRFTTRRGVSVSGRETNYPHETRIGFQLAKPLTI